MEGKETTQYEGRTTATQLRLVWCGSLEKVVPVHMSFSSSERCSKLQSPSKNSPRVASNVSSLPIDGTINHIERLLAEERRVWCQVRSRSRPMIAVQNSVSKYPSYCFKTRR
ncbi:hypothetical protein AVEN_136056-1 [Araneus ventricosus]|uniref:Uncharacterized protein n=1 Tax=Araneus ventricosus TaxID=182803 RepID=A0A4Y2QJ89_ARAVE|nr:hypothetical protein AVEN_136056-1 [Araneus ventricosus]